MPANSRWDLIRGLKVKAPSKSYPYSPIHFPKFLSSKNHLMVTEKFCKTCINPTKYCGDESHHCSIFSLDRWNGLNHTCTQYITSPVSVNLTSSFLTRRLTSHRVKILILCIFCCYISIKYIIFSYWYSKESRVLMILTFYFFCRYTKRKFKILFIA
jgi:hypothetical protein